MARYEAGETLASIARTYDCSPPAISYIVSRNREQPATETPAPPAGEPQLIKVQPNGAATDATAPNEPSVVPPAPPKQAAEIRREPAADARPNGAAGAEPRPKLHLSLGNGNGSHPVTNGNGHGAERAAAAERPVFAAPRPPQPQGAGERNGQHPVQAPRDADAPRKDNGAFIDQELRTRVDGDIAAFLAAFDMALAEDTQASRFGLREATDRLLRAGARTRIELERLEARVPLARDPAAAAVDPAAWRYR